MDLPEFDNPSLLRRALTHRSYLNEHLGTGEHNERLEFLGDAVLDFLAGAYLYHQFPELREGGLTRLRAALVRTSQLAVFAAALNLGQQLRLSKGEEETGGRNRETLLAAAFESVVGAYYLDSGIEAVRAFVEPFLAEAAVQMVVDQRLLDPKSQFQEWAQAELGATPRYQVAAVSGPDHERLYTIEVVVGETVYGSGQGPNKQSATQAAAQSALVRAGLA